MTGTSGALDHPVIGKARESLTRGGSADAVGLAHLVFNWDALTGQKLAGRDTIEYLTAHVVVERYGRIWVEPIHRRNPMPNSRRTGS